MSKAIELEVIEGTWEEIFQQSSRLTGRRLRVMILPANATPHDASSVDETARRVEGLNAWFAMPRPLSVPLPRDDRAVIYEDDQRDSR